MEVPGPKCNGCSGTLNDQPPLASDLYRLPPCGEKPLAVSVVQIALGTRPDYAIRVGNHVQGVQLGDSLICAEALKPRTQKMVDAVFSSRP